MRATVLAAIVLAAIVGCGGTNSSNSSNASSGTGASSTSSGTLAGSSTSSGGTGATGTGGGGLGGGLNVGDGGTNQDCSDAAQLLYVWGSDNEIYSFDPPTKAFTPVATPDCPSNDPNSMAIDRNLVAWLNYTNPPGIYKFDLTKKSGCTLAIPLTVGLDSHFGMGFSTDMVGGTTETLYLDNLETAALDKAVNDMLVPIGMPSNDTNLKGQIAELTGTGDARLFGFFDTMPDVRIAEIDKATASIKSDQVLTGLATVNDFAFSFWGGDFYIYAYPVPQNNSMHTSVVRYSPGTNTVDLAYIPDIGFDVVGAGASTCAPLTPPK